MTEQIKFGMIGGGVMGEALLSRLVAQNIYQPQEILVSEPLESRRDFLAKQYKINVTNHNQLVASATQSAILLAIKPQIFSQVVPDLVNAMAGKREKPLIISILAGTTLEKLETAFHGFPVVRVMPNTPAIVGAGVSAIAPGKLVEPGHLDLAKNILQAVGQVLEVPENMMDAVTGLSGSGPAYVALIVEALADGGVYAGLPRAIAAQLALQTVLGTARLIEETGSHPAQLKDQVTSPGGTTIAGVAQLENHGLRAALINAVKAATERSKELGR